MICPECEKGGVVVPRTKGQIQPLTWRDKETPAKYFKKVPCPRCNGSGIAYYCGGDDVSQPDPIIGQPSSTGEAKLLVA